MDLIRAIPAMLLLSVGFAACGGEGHEEDEHNFDSYADCYDAESGKGATYAITECDEMFDAETHADRAACDAFYAENGVPQEVASARCDEEFPPA